PAADLQQPPSDESAPTDPELREALRGYLERRLRTDLGLTDAQAETLMPKLEAMQSSQARVRREKRVALQELRRLYHSGATDSELQGGLDRLDGIDEEYLVETKRRMSDIDDSLTVRQRVRFRILLVEIREDVQRRMRQLQMAPGGRRGQGPVERPGGP
ncbi:MAG: hypothetical protein R3344_13435, partial [Acidobacteriota bacterium]|nr:hypothetical protein [Acidobacteriota bacterium]